MKSARIGTPLLLFFWALSCVSLLAAPGGEPASFGGLRIRLVGTVLFQGDASALIEIGATGEQRFVDLDDEVEGFAVRDILTDRIVFFRDEKQFVLPLRQEVEKDELKIVRASTIKAPPPKALLAKISSSNSRPRLAMPYIHNNSKSWPGFVPPIDTAIRSGFGQRRDPLGGGTRFHYGADLAASYGTTIRSAGEGVVSVAGYNSRLGYHVELKHPNDFSTLYGHLSKVLVQEGQHVSSGAVLGLSGSSGRSTGPHLHFEIRKKGIAVDPSIYVPNLGR